MKAMFRGHRGNCLRCLREVSGLVTHSKMLCVSYLFYFLCIKWKTKTTKNQLKSCMPVLLKQTKQKWFQNVLLGWTKYPFSLNTTHTSWGVVSNNILKISTALPCSLPSNFLRVISEVFTKQYTLSLSLHGITRDYFSFLWDGVRDVRAECCH